MLIDKNEIAMKLKKMKGLFNGKIHEHNQGILVKGNSLYASNYEIGIKTILDIENSDEEFVIPKKAIELIENLPAGEVEITGDSNSIKIKCGSIKNKYQTFPADTYVIMESIDDSNNRVTVQSGEFQDALNSVLYSVSETTKKETLQGVLLDASDGTLVVTDIGLRGAKSNMTENLRLLFQK